jgi:hypothetical protein
MIKEKRLQNLLQKSDSKALAGFVLYALNDLIWDKQKRTRIKALKKGRHEDVLQLIEGACQTAIEKSLFHLNDYDSNSSDMLFVEALRQYLKIQQIEILGRKIKNGSDSLSEAVVDHIRLHREIEN